MADLLNTTRIVLSSLIDDHKMPEMAIIKVMISQLLGYGILAGACITKLPQILLIRKAGSAEGLSTEMFEIETYTLLVSALYGYVQGLPFNTYGESAILAVQNVVILMMVYGYSKTHIMRRLAAAAAYKGMVAAVLSGRVGSKRMTQVAEGNTLVVMTSRLPQVYKNFRSRSTGTLSGITTFINVMGCIVRVFTTMQAGAGGAMLRGYLVSLAINGTLLWQIIAYRKNTAAQLKARKEKSAAASSGKKDK